MQIKNVRVWSENLKLTKPYSISYETIDSVKNVFVHIELEDGPWGIGSGSPAEFVTGEDNSSCINALKDYSNDLLLNKNINSIESLCKSINKILPSNPAARAALDIALFDAYSKIKKVPLFKIFGRCHDSFYTSITIGIKSIEESAKEAEEYVARGFHLLKVKTGSNVEHDIDLIHKLRETIGVSVGIRVDANQGYTKNDLIKFVKNTEKQNIELIEQPLSRESDNDMKNLPKSIQRKCAADESLIDPDDAVRLSKEPYSFGIYNIKLMKCGGLSQAKKISQIANENGIELMWGCMDESIISISAALHIALSSPTTKYLDLDGSFDLAKDIVSGGFKLKDGKLTPSMRPGLGVEFLEGISA